LDWPLFFSALISATLFPGGSEAVLLFRLQQGQSPLPLVMIATMGNVLGSLITYAMGRIGYRYTHLRWTRPSQRRIEQAQRWFSGYGQWSLLFAWLPFIGDPLCLVAGLLRSPLPWFILLVSIGKAARYIVLTWLPI